MHCHFFAVILEIMTAKKIENDVLSANYKIKACDLFLPEKLLKKILDDIVNIYSQKVSYWRIILGAPNMQTYFRRQKTPNWL
jgi:hypothetical protein